MSSSSSSSQSLSPQQQRLYEGWIALIAEATAGGAADLAPLQRLAEQALHQNSPDRSAADTTAALLQLIPEASLQLRSQQSSKLRIWLLEFSESLLSMDPMAFTPPVLTLLTSMTAEENVAVVKRVVSLGCVLYPMLWSWLLWRAGAWGAVHERMRTECVQLKSQLLAMWQSPTEGVKPLVVKFMEVVCLTLTNDRPSAVQRQAMGGKGEEMRPFTLRELPPHHSVLDATILREEADGVLHTLLECTPATATTFSSLLKCLASLAKMRSSLFGARIVERLTNLVDVVLMEEASLQLLPSEQQVKRVRNDIKAALLDVMKTCNLAQAESEQQARSMEASLQSMGYEIEGKECMKQLEKKKAAMLVQQSRLAAPAAGAAAAAAAAAAPEVSYEFVASASSPEMRILAFHLSQLPAHSVTQLVMSSLNRFVVPSNLVMMHGPGAQTREVSNLFAQFVAACSEHAPEATRVAGGSTDQRQAAEQMLAQAAMATSTAPAEDLLAMEPEAPAAPVSTLTVVPPVPIPDISEKGYESLARSAFARIASSKTQAAVARSGESALRNVILAKLAATNLLHPLRYTHTIDPELASDDAEADSWNSSLVATENHQLLLSYITKDWAGYENALNWLYSLLLVDGQSAQIETRVREPAESKEEDEEEEQKEGDAAPDVDMKDGEADAAPPSNGAAVVKRKREEDVDAEEDGASELPPDSKRARKDEPSEAAAALRPSVLPTFEVHGTVEYQETVSRLLTSLEASPLFSQAASASSSRQNLYSRFLLDLPLLTPAVFKSLDGCVYDPARSVIGLCTLRDLILYRPPVREQALQLLLSYTYKPEQSRLRNQSIRLVVNQLFTPHPHLRDRITRHAHQLIDALAEPSTLEDLPEITVNVVVPPVPVYDKIVLPPVAPPKATTDVAPADPAVKVEPGAATAAATSALPAGSPTIGTASSRAMSDLKTRAEISAMIFDAERKKKEFDRLVFFRSLKEKEKKLLEQQRDERARRRTDRITRHMELFLALCTRQPSMLRHIFQVYRRCGEFVRHCMHEQIPPLITALLRVDVEGLIATLEAESAQGAQGTQGAGDSEPLVLYVLQLMTDRAPPSAALVAAVLRMYGARGSNPRYLLPVLPGLPLDSIRRHLPRLLLLPLDQLRIAFQKLLHSKPPSSIKPSELLVALHLMQPEPRRRAPGQPQPSEAQMAKERKEDEDAMDKRVVAAKKLCLEDSEAYPADVLGAVLSQLSDAVVLPRLLLHTLIMCLRLHPALRSYIVSSLLLKLIARKVYAYPTLWSGFMRAANELRPQSIPILVQLPDQPFEQLLLQPSTPSLQMDELKKQLADFVRQHPMQARLSIRRMMQTLAQQQHGAHIQQQQ